MLVYGTWCRSVSRSYSSNANINSVSRRQNEFLVPSLDATSNVGGRAKYGLQLVGFGGARDPSSEITEPLSFPSFCLYIGPEEEKGSNLISL